MRAKRVLFVGDGGDAAALAERSGGDFVIEGHVRHLPFSIGALRRHWGYWGLAWFACRQRRTADCILFWQQFVAIYYQLLSLLMPWARRPVLVYYVIYKPAANVLVDWIKRKVMAITLNASQVAVVYFMSREDVLYSLIRKDARRIIAEHPFRSRLIEENFSQATSEGFFFSGGVSNRDYAVIRKLAERMPEHQFRIACMASQAENLLPLPPNLQVRTDVSTAEFEDLVLHSVAVVIPLENRNVVSGQLVCMAAMQSGKPVFMSRNGFVREWLDMGPADRFLHLFDEADDLAVQLSISGSDTLLAMGAAAREYYLAHHDESVVYRRFAEDLRHVARARSI